MIVSNMHTITLHSDMDTKPTDLHDFYFTYIALLRAGAVWFHSAHHVSRGVSFAGDHVSLYPQIYNFFVETVDNVVEKSVAQCGSELACPQEQLAAATQVVCCYPSPPSLSPTAIAAAGLCIVNDAIQFLEEQFRNLDGLGQLSLGLNDMIMSHASRLEDLAYLLKQRVAVEMDASSA